MAQACNEDRGIKTLSSRTGSGLAKLFAFIARANQVARERRALARLGEAALKDFAASRADALEEAGRPWWDLPDCDRHAA
jgi:uncharacterized protein YjiS (DUF1127 family)